MVEYDIASLMERAGSPMFFFINWLLICVRNKGKFLEISCPDNLDIIYVNAIRADGQIMSLLPKDLAEESLSPYRSSFLEFREELLKCFKENYNRETVKIGRVALTMYGTFDLRRLRFYILDDPNIAHLDDVLSEIMIAYQELKLQSAEKRSKERRQIAWLGLIWILFALFVLFTVCFFYLIWA